MAEQRNRLLEARRLLGGGDCGVIQIDGKPVKVRLTPSGILIGVGKRHASVRLDPFEIASAST